MEPQVGLQSDEDRIIQLALNLIENAIKYTPEGGSVTVSVLGAGHNVRFVVANTGQGIPPEHLQHIFDYFYRLDWPRNRDQGGFGLGLAIAQQIVLLHHGEIKVARLAHSFW
jgi:signal transduction histidine kinase